MNVYEDATPRNRMEISECEKTEDVYQTLHQPPPLRNTPSTHGSVRGRKIKVVLLVISTLLLVIILIMVGLFTAKYQQTTPVTESQTTVVDGKSEKEELWRLHDDEFYLFWEAEGSCAEAQKFCADRKSRIGEVTDKNKDWILSQSKGKKLWMNIGSVTTANLSETLRQCPLVWGDSGRSEGEQGWVCGTERQELDIPFHFYHNLDHLTTPFDDTDEDFSDYDFITYALEDPTETPAGPTTSAVCVHSLKMYVMLVCVLPSLYF